MGYFWGWGMVRKLLGSTHVVEQLSFSMFLSILTFDFESILGLFFTFLGPNGLFFGGVGVGFKNSFWVLVRFKLFWGLLM